MSSVLHAVLPATSTWPWVDHVVSRLPPPTNSPYSDSLSLRLRIRRLNLAVTVTRRIIMQKARRHPLTGHRLRPLVGIWFQVLFTPLIGVLFTFRSPYWFTIGHQGVFSLAGWSPQIQTGFHVSRPTQVPFGMHSLSPTGLSPSMVGLSRPFCYHDFVNSHVTALQPRRGNLPVWAVPLSLAATDGIAVSFFSSRY